MVKAIKAISSRSLCLVPLLLTSAVSAEQVTLDQALVLANRGHPLLRAGAAGVDAAAAGIATAGAYPNPEASFIAGRDNSLPGGGRTGVPQYVVAQPLELGALRPSRIELAERGKTSSEHYLGEVRLGVLSHVRRTFFQALRRMREVRIAVENVRLVQDLRDRIQVRVNVGEVGRLELVRAEAEVASAQTVSSSAQLQQVTALAQFRAAVGGRLAPQVELDGDLDQQIVLPPIEMLRQEARGRHPALALARSEISRADARLSYERALRTPQPAVVSEIDMTGPSYRFGVALPILAWNRRQGPIAEAAAGLQQATALAQAREIEILAALEGAYERYAVATQQVSMFEQGLLREAEEALRAAEVAYQLGERGILEVLDAQRLLRMVRLNFLNAQFDRQAALVDLDELRAVDLRRNP
jgi:cobalt-zinc-cadmium efflux system outer membrane protein